MKAPLLLAAGAVIGLGIGIVVADSFRAPNIGEQTAGVQRGQGPSGQQAGQRTGQPARQGRRGYAPVVLLEQAQSSSVRRRIDVIGQARALRSVAVTSEVTGRALEVNIAPGARVSAGDVLVRIDDAEQRIELSRARADFPIAKDNAERYRELEIDEAASQLESEQAQNTFVAAKAQLEAAEVAYQLRRIAAPFDGIAGLSDIEAGDYIRAGDVITTLDDTTSVVIEFSAPQEFASFINIGQDVSAALTSYSGQAYKGVVTAIDSRIDSVSRALRVEAQFDNPDGRIIPGAVFAVTTQSPGEPAIAIPGLAIQWDRSGAFVWRRNNEGTAERAGVVVLQRHDDTVLVEGDVNVGDWIVSEGADRVRRGVPLPGETTKKPAGGALVNSSYNNE